MNKRGWIIVGILIVLVVVIIMSNFNNQPTGEAIRDGTNGATYGRLSRDFNDYRSCSYVSENDKWDVMTKTKIEFYKKTGEGPFYVEDECYEGFKVREYDCDGEYRVYRIVVCPEGMTCVDGACA